MGEKNVGKVTVNSLLKLNVLPTSEIPFISHTVHCTGLITIPSLHLIYIFFCNRVSDDLKKVLKF